MKIAFASAEMSPFAKTGGLGDVLGALPLEVSRLGHEVKVLLPYYEMVRKQNFPMTLIMEDLVVALGEQSLIGRVLSYREQALEVLFFDFPEFYERDQLYGTEHGDYPDNDRRFILYQRACFEALRRLRFSPDIFHCHDWQAGLIPALLKTVYHEDPLFQKTRSIFTIHNLAYQGGFSKESFALTNIPPSEFKEGRMAYYGGLNHMHTALVYADVLTTVSERYSQEIQTSEYGCGLELQLRARQRDLHGVINGIRNEDWSPATDENLTVPFRPNEWSLKLANKGILQKEIELPVEPGIPLLAMVTRLAEQKGLDILLEAIDVLMKLPLQLVVLGTGDAQYQRKLGEKARQYPEKLQAVIRFDLQLSKRIYAGADVFLMPSRFEPCGLGQLISLRYGTVPLVRETGGLADTITAFDPKSGKGNGISFKPYTAEALVEAVKEALLLFKDKSLWHQVVENGMQQDFSWRNSATKYVALYETAQQQKVVPSTIVKVSPEEMKKVKKKSLKVSKPLKKKPALSKPKSVKKAKKAAVKPKVAKKAKMAAVVKPVKKKKKR